MESNNQSRIKREYDIRIANEASDGLKEVSYKKEPVYEAYKKRMKELMDTKSQKEAINKLKENKYLCEEIENMRGDFNTFLATF